MKSKFAEFPFQIFLGVAFGTHCPSEQTDPPPPTNKAGINVIFLDKLGKRVMGEIRANAKINIFHQLMV